MKQAGILTGLLLIALGALWLLSPKTEETTPVTPEESQVRDAQEPTPAQSGKIDEHLTIDETLREVNFCGKTYKVKQILIDGVDVVQRVAEIAIENKKVEEYPQYKGTGEICNILTKSYAENAELQALAHASRPPNTGEAIDYTLGIDRPEIVGILFQFDISTSEDSIYIIGRESGDFVERIPIGALKK